MAIGGRSTMVAMMSAARSTHESHRPMISASGPSASPSTRSAHAPRVGSAWGPGFVTGTESTKALEIAATGGIAAALTWPAMFRAIRFRGVAEQLSRDEVAGYFGSRPWASRISAWASRQSQPVEGRAPLEEAYERYAAQFPDRGKADDVPVPDFWGGYRVACDEVEFWGGRRNRLHDRLVFTRVGAGSLDDADAWSLSRRQP